MNNNKVFGYVRVSTKEQNPDRQTQSIKQYCKSNNLKLDERDIIIDKASGKDFSRTGYITLTNTLLRAGDILTIKELDRLGRNMIQIKEEWNKLINMGINIIVLDTPILNTNNKTDLEKNLISNIIFELLSYMAEKERLKIKQRQREGIERAKAQGKHLGRPSIPYPSNWTEIYNEWKNKHITAVKAMELLGLKKNTFYKLVKKYQEDVS